MLVDVVVVVAGADFFESLSVSTRGLSFNLRGAAEDVGIIIVGGMSGTRFESSRFLDRTGLTIIRGWRGALGTSTVGLRSSSVGGGGMVIRLGGRGAMYWWSTHCRYADA